MPPPTSEEVKLQKEYIGNLQQQIYFLEMELKLMKEKGPSVSREGDDGAPIETVITQLQDKYDAMEERHQKSMEEVKMLNDRLLHDNKRFKKENERLVGSISTLKSTTDLLRENIEKLKKKNLGDRLNFDQKTVRLENRLLSQERQNETLLKKYKDEKVSTHTEILKLHSSLKHATETANEYEHKYREADTKLRNLEVKMLELSDTDSNLRRIHSMEDKVRAAQEETVEWKTRCKKLEIEFEKAKCSANKQAELCDQLVSENGALNNQIQELHEEVEDQKRNWAENGRRGELWSEKIVDLQRENASLQEQQEDFPKQIESVRDELLASQEDVALYKSLCEEKSMELERIHDELGHVGANESTLRENNSKLKRELRLLYEEFVSVRDKYAVTSKKLAEVEEELSTTIADKEHLEAKIDVSKRIDSLEMDKLASMMESNRSVAAKIEDLINGVSRVENVTRQNNAAHQKPPSFRAFSIDPSAGADDQFLNSVAGSAYSPYVEVSPRLSSAPGSRPTSARPIKEEPAQEHEREEEDRVNRTSVHQSHSSHSYASSGSFEISGVKTKSPRHHHSKEEVQHSSDSDADFAIAEDTRRRRRRVRKPSVSSQSSFEIADTLVGTPRRHHHHDSRREYESSESELEIASGEPRQRGRHSTDRGGRRESPLQTPRSVESVDTEGTYFEIADSSVRPPREHHYHRQKTMEREALRAGSDDDFTIANTPRGRSDDDDDFEIASYHGDQAPLSSARKSNRDNSDAQSDISIA